MIIPKNNFLRIPVFEKIINTITIARTMIDRKISQVTQPADS